MGSTVDENVRASEIWAEEVIHLNCPASQGVCSVSTCVEVPTFLLYVNYHRTKALHLIILVLYVFFVSCIHLRIDTGDLRQFC